MTQHWRERSRPARLEKRYEFSNYEDLSDFLERAADLSERKGFYPDMGFGRDYVNVTVHADEGSKEFTRKQYDFVKQLEDLRENRAAASA